jgi:arginine/lysine/ornithine decarboxylase
MTLREAMFGPAEWTPVDRAAGRVCAAPTVSCPPAVPIAVSGEVISPETIEVFRYYGIEAVRVVADS